MQCVFLTHPLTSSLTHREGELWSPRLDRGSSPFIILKRETDPFYIVVTTTKDEGGEPMKIKYLQKVSGVIINDCVITSLTKGITVSRYIALFEK